MSSPTSFDPYASSYDQVVQSAIGASGESVAYFAELKAMLAKTVAPADTARILDFGCGIGNTTRALAAEFSGATVLGIDSSPASLREAASRPHPPNVAFSGDELLRSGSGDFDLAIAACVFHHIPTTDRHEVARSIRSMLRPEGRFVIFEHNPLNPLTQRVVRKVPFDADAELLSRGAASRLLRESGFTLRSRRYYFFFPRILRRLRFLEPALGQVPFGAQYFVTGERPADSQGQ